MSNNCSRVSTAMVRRASTVRGPESFLFLSGARFVCAAMGTLKSKPTAIADNCLVEIVMLNKRKGWSRLIRPKLQT